MRISAGSWLLLTSMLALQPAAARADSRAQKYYYEAITEPFFIPDAAHPGWYRSQREGGEKSSFPAVKAPGTFRVFVLGGSIAQLLATKRGKGALDDALREALPSLTVEVLNCGMAGYDSYREALIEQEILDYAPDLIVFLTGHNEGLGSAPVPIWIMHAQERLSRFGAFRALVKALHSKGDNGPLKVTGDYDARDKTFAANLAQNIRHARERGVAVAVVVPPRNYREPVELRRMVYDAEFVPGWIRFMQGDSAGARALWKKTLDAAPKDNVSLEPHKAFTESFIARAEEKLDLWSEARDSFDRAADLDRAAICGGRCQRILRHETEKEGGFLVEADRMFRAISSPRLPGLETFNDRMHWRPQYNCLMSMEIISALRADARLGALPWDAGRIKALASSCEKPGGASTEEDDTSLLGNVLMNLSWPEFSRLSMSSVFYLQAMRKRRPGWFTNIPALVKRTPNPQTRTYGVTMASDSVIVPRFYWHIGEARMLEKDYAGAAADFEKALSLDPSLQWTRLSLAVAVTLRGDKKRGLELLKDTLARSAADASRDDIAASVRAAGSALGLPVDELLASDPDHWLSLAQTEIAAGHRAPALAALERARSVSPQPHQLRIIGQYYLQLHELDEFLKLSDELSKLFPEDVDFWVARAEGSFLSDRRDAGLESLKRAESLNPQPHQRKIIAAWRRWLASGGPPPR